MTTYTLLEDVVVTTPEGERTEYPFLMQGDTTVNGEPARSFVVLPDGSDESQDLARTAVDEAFAKLARGGGHPLFAPQRTAGVGFSECVRIPKGVRNDASVS